MNPFSLFSVRNKKDFENKALWIFRLQTKKNPVYGNYVKQIGINPENVKNISQIPFLPIEFFKSNKVVTVGSREWGEKKAIFLSSGTTGMKRSKHYVADISLYEKSFRKCFEIFYGEASKYVILALLPSYYENKNSSLIYMMMDLIKRSKNKDSAFYNPKDENLFQLLKTLLQKKQKVILFGVSFALLDLSPSCLALPKRFAKARRGLGEELTGHRSRGDLIVLETGGMKGKREELTREELHKILCKKFRVKKIHSEYGMTELISQAYSKGDGIFRCPPWMKVFVRDVNDPFQIMPRFHPDSGQNYEIGRTNEKQTTTGAINIIDLANINSCSFIATQDVGRMHSNNSFEVLGRMDNSDWRGCNLLAG